MFATDSDSDSDHDAVIRVRRRVAAGGWPRREVTVRRGGPVPVDLAPPSLTVAAGGMATEKAIASAGRQLIGPAAFREPGPPDLAVTEQASGYGMSDAVGFYGGGKLTHTITPRFARTYATIRTNFFYGGRMP